MGPPGHSTAPATAGSNDSATNSPPDELRSRVLSVELIGNRTDKGVQGVYRAFRDAARTQFSEAGMRTGFTGSLADTVDTTDSHETAAKVGGALLMGLILLINVLVFRSVLAALLPLVAVAMIIGVAGEPSRVPRYSPGASSTRALLI
ncbi:MMPL family transporter [Streptomyces sanglieri]|uniref:MMPL family transporter n=1 Tax=Streptomyces sanglieri TaxID=193460 RepID=A0ABW2X8I1_9ACTN